jgi:hypothetical protein
MRRCQATLLPSGAACGELAEVMIEWRDGTTSSVCTNCRLRLEQIAAAHGTMLRWRRLV